MFGYVRIRKPELKIKDYEVYRGFYCGLCSVLKKEYGFSGQVTLTYDMTFLVILLSSVYDITTKRKQERCIVHPGRKHLCLTNEVTVYAAHLNMLLTWYHLQDDYQDERSGKAGAGLVLYRRGKKKAAGALPGIEGKLSGLLSELSGLEQGEEDIGRLSDCFGRLMAELFDYRQDALTGYLQELGYHLGRFIYIMDAYDDLEQDRKKGCFNPLAKRMERADFEAWAEEMLLDEMALAGAAFQKLPCLEYTDILGNILYAGVWNRYDELQQDRKKENEIQEAMKNDRSI